MHVLVSWLRLALSAVLAAGMGAAAAQDFQSRPVRLISLLPDVPTLAECGVPGYSFDAWMALIAPTGLPKATLDRLNAATRTALASPEVQEAFGAQRLLAAGSVPDAGSSFLQSELDDHTRLVKRSGATLD